jgi:hypothetical protein
MTNDLQTYRVYRRLQVAREMKSFLLLLLLLLLLLRLR